MEKSFLPPFVVQWIEEKKGNIEIVLLCALVLTFLFYQSGMLSPVILMFSMLTISGCYFLLAHVPLVQTQNTLKNICVKVTGIGSAVTINGILFLILGIEGGDLMLFIGTLSLIPVTLYLAYTLLVSYSSYFAVVALRTFVLAVAGSYYYVLTAKI
jgi:hypothetical protein